MHVLLDTSPLRNGHQARGIGRYTQELLSFLQKQPDVTLVDRQRENQKPDIIHYPTFDLYRPSLPLIHSCPVVVTIHDLIPLRFPDHYPSGMRGQLALLWQKMALKMVNLILTDSHESRADICRFLQIKPSKVIVIPLGVSEQFRPLSQKTAAPLLAKHGIKTPYILYVGDINYNKNLPALITALSKLPTSVDLVMVGRNFRPQPIPEWQAIDVAIKQHDLSDRVKMINDLDQSQNTALRALYSQALCYVQPSLAEGFGLPVLEAMACGTIVLASQTPALKEVGAGVAFYASPEAKSIAEGVKKIMRLSPSRRREKKREGLAWAKGFSWRRTGKATVLIYQKIVSGQFD